MAETKFKAILGKNGDLGATVEGKGIELAQLIDWQKELNNSKLKAKEMVCRHLLASIIVAGLFTALLVATVWGWQHADFSGLHQVCDWGGYLLSGVAGYYFGKDGSRR